MSEASDTKYSDESFWSKVKSNAKKLGEKVLEPALKMYYSAQDPDTPLWAKTTIYSALAYLISPVDAIPDALPGGLVDDYGILLSAMAAVAAHIKPEHTEKAKATIKRWLS
jgi:uncharacterized membrane protein YkvA (DUF1232 family)